MVAVRFFSAWVVAWVFFTGGTGGVVGGAAFGEERFVTLASTTSTENSGLLGDLLPRFTAKTGIDVRVVAVGTGQSLRIARNGDADLLLVHDRKSEEAFVAEGWGVERVDVMYNDFVLLGPKDDADHMSEDLAIGNALAWIAEHQRPFVSRGDDSGTHKAELRLWAAAGIDPRAHSGTWYRETGSGMGATLNTASAMAAYTLADRGTWLSFKNPGPLVILVEDEPPLWNPYSVILVNPERHPHVKAADAQALIDWLVSQEGQDAIDAFRVNGKALFKANSRGRR